MASLRALLIMSVWLLSVSSPPVMCGAEPEETYPVHPDSQPQPGVPQGKVIAGRLNESKLFPGTERDYWIYVPHQYDGKAPAALMVFQDGQSFLSPEGAYRVTTVFDNLIHRGEMPVTIGLFISPGIVPKTREDAQPRFNRSFEYDSMDERYATFLLQEVLPLVESQHELRITADPNLRGICGSSSGGICAFSVAWHRPDQFRRVLTTVGTYVGLRGGHEYSTLVRKTEPKPLRVFLQDGSNDVNNFGGDWWMANQAMLRSLRFSGYEVEHAWGEGGHNPKHGAAILPDAMRWLWKDHATTTVKTHPESNQNDMSRFFPGQNDGENGGWELVSQGHEWAEGMALTDDGTLYFTDVPGSKLYRISPTGEQKLLVPDTGNANGIALGPDGRIYAACSGAQQIRAWDPLSLQMETIIDGTTSNDIVVRQDGTIYYTDPRAGKVWMVRPQSHERIEVDVLENCNGIGMSSDQTQLFVAHFPGRFIYVYQIAADGSLRHKQPYFHLELPVNTLEGHLDGMCSTEEGWLVATSELGVQVLDPIGRSHLILPMPIGAKRACYARFGGPGRQFLYVANVDRIWRRKSSMVGARPWSTPVKPPVPKL